jgi:hypothetical protein
MNRHYEQWTDEELKRLAAIVAAGGTALRAAAALKRNLLSCQNKARQLDTPNTPVRITRRNSRERCGC